MSKSSPAEAVCRGEPIIRRVLGATVSELGRVGYAALSVERVATLARVNKTTVYRRWPTKLDLVRTAFVAAGNQTWKDPDTGSLRGDLIEIALSNLRFARSVWGKAIVRTLLSGELEAGLREVILALRDSIDARSRDVVARAVSRGEVGARLDYHLLVELIVGSVQYGSLLNLRTGRAEEIEKLVDIILLGILKPEAQARKSRAPGRRRLKRQPA